MSIRIGDKFYVAAEVVATGVGGEAQSYKLVTDNRDKGTQFYLWLDEEDLAAPVPKLPIAVAQELENAKRYVSLPNYIGVVLTMSSESSFQKTVTWLKTSEDSEKVGKRIQMLANAWLDGWDIEAKYYNLILGNNDDVTKTVLFKQDTGSVHIKETDPVLAGYELKSDNHYQFTQDEIDELNKNFWIKGIDLNDYKVEVKDDEEV